ncbi:MAG: hypothetical protein PWP23_576 [Candidatus Sumerlaeota bacterium]|nr:hypothetical protein [Candidatus Sumerlaeota bacterium]
MSLRRNILMLMSIALGLAGCASSVQNRNPVGEQFPAVSGESLAGKAYELPADLEGKPAVLLVGYVMKAQFDLDRWLLGITQAGLPVQVYEVPAAKRVFSPLRRHR